MPLPPLRPPSLARYASYLCSQVAKTTARVLSDGLADHHLRLPHFAVLAALHDSGTACQQDIADALDLDKSHMVGFVEDLHAAGLVERDRDPADRRRYRLTVSSAGQAALSDLHAVEQDCQETVFGVLDPAERATLADLLSRVVAAADARRLGEHAGSPADTEREVSA